MFMWDREFLYKISLLSGETETESVKANSDRNSLRIKKRKKGLTVNLFFTFKPYRAQSQMVIPVQFTPDDNENTDSSAVKHFNF